MQGIEQKIQAAIQPLIDRITLLQGDNLKFKQEIAALQATHQNKNNHKPQTTTHGSAVQRPSTTANGKGTRVKPVETHNETKPQPKVPRKPQPKKQETKPQQEEVKIENGKTSVTKQPKPIPSPTANKDVTADTKNAKDIKPKPTTAAGVKRQPPVIANKSGLHDKKIVNKSEQLVKKQEEGEDKNHASQQQKPQHKNQAHNAKNTKVPPPKKPTDLSSKNPTTSVKVPPVPKTTGTGLKKANNDPVIKKGPEQKIEHTEVTQKFESVQHSQSPTVIVQQLIVPEAKQQTIPEAKVQAEVPVVEQTKVQASVQQKTEQHPVQISPAQETTEAVPQKQKKVEEHHEEESL